MSRADARRPLRLHAVSELAGELPRPDAASPALAAERFRRTLLGGSRRGSEEASPRDTTRGAGGSQGSAKASHGAPALVLAHLASDVESPSPAGVVRPVLPALAAEWQLPAPEAAQPPAITAPTAAAGEGWAEQMAQQVVGLYRRADPAFVTWTVTVPLDPLVLPETELRLHLSPHWLSLRFATQSPQSAHLVLLHSPRLQLLLQQTPELPHGIDIEVT